MMGWKNLFLLSFLIGTIFLSCGWAQEAKLQEGEYTIGGIRVEGADHLNPAAIVEFSKLYVGKRIRIPGDDIAKAIERLWKQQVFSFISIGVEKVVDDKVFLVVRVEERPRIARFAFRGVRKNEADDLREKIPFIRGTIFTPEKQKHAERVIRNFFIQKGYYMCKVEFEIKPDTTISNGVLILMNIQKGPRIKVKQIHFEGNRAFSDKKLKRKLKNTKEKRFYRFWKRSKYVSSKFQEDLERLISFYNEYGYRDFQVLKDSVRLLNGNQLEIYIQVEEGRQYYFGNITWIGNYKYDATTLDKVLQIEKGDVYNVSLLERRLYMDPNGMDVSSLYLNDGYLFFRVEPVETSIRGDTIDLEMRIFEGPQATNARVLVEGNTKTSDWVILREIRTLPGDKFSRALLIRSQRELANLNYFDPQQMNVIPQPDPEEGTVDLKYVVAEKPSDQIFLQGGWGGNIRDAQGNIISSGLLLTLGLTLNNFATRKVFKPKEWNPIPAGDGQRLSLNVQMNGTGFQNYAISFTEPWLGKYKPKSLGISANYSIQRSIFSNYFISIFGASVDLGLRMKFPDDFFRSYTSFNYRYYVVKDASYVFSNFTDGFINIFSISQTFDRTSIDAPIYPRSGSLFVLSFETTPPYSLILKRNYTEMSAEERYNLLEYYKINFRAGFYLNPFGKFVIHPRMRFGYLGSYSKAYGVSPFQRFYLGGDGLQGYNLDGREVIALRGYRFPYIGDPFGSTIYDKFTIEIRQALTLNPTATLWLQAFFEAGNASSDLFTFNPFELKRSVGAGIRIFMPMFGLLGVDYGYGFDPVYYNGAPINGSNFHFMIGEQF